MGQNRLTNFKTILSIERAHTESLDSDEGINYLSFCIQQIKEGVCLMQNFHAQ